MKPIAYLALFNLIGLLLSMAYGVLGGSGGGTTEAVFTGIALTGAVTGLGCLYVAVFRRQIIKTKWFLLLALLLISCAEANLLHWGTLFT